MAKINMPLMSEKATGSIGKSLIYTTAKLTKICKGFFVSKDRKTERKIFIRSVFIDGKNAWIALPEEEKNSYKTKAKNKKMTGYNLFMKEYLTYWIPQGQYGRYEKGKYERALYHA